MTTNIELNHDEESFLIATVGRTIKIDVDMIRDWNNGKKAYSLGRVNRARRCVALMKKLSGKDYEYFFELFALS